MTVKTGVSLTERHHAFALAKVKEGRFASISSVVAAGIEQIMHDEEEREIALDAMRETITQRMSLPRDEWFDLEEDDLFEQARQRLAAR